MVGGGSQPAAIWSIDFEHNIVTVGSARAGLVQINLNSFSLSSDSDHKIMKDEEETSQCSE